MARSEKNVTLRFETSPCFRVFSGQWMVHFLWDAPYPKEITPAHRKALYDLTAVSSVIGKHLGKPWLTLVEPSVVLGPDQEYRRQMVDPPTNVYIVRKIDAEAMKVD